MADISLNIAIVGLTLTLAIINVDAIGCFVCTSINHDNPDCEDTFNNTGKFYQADCWATRRDRVGMFPGTQCIKMFSIDEQRKVTTVVRNCVVDDGGTNSETEIGRQSHCGWMKIIKFGKHTMRGCILSCDKDACNHGNRAQFSSILALIAAVICCFLQGIL
ncbi:uncharacterized protein LOC131938479 isoform X1 [Physella acuta]|uniref:uncharacterized protein LOC131938479 isoform X1 n=1 Tax=Physella acuta TaxID=109671 RepID=UPI0027DE9FC8|nr:uncharacterized protein LOC131938479 isoform X1 [Physella acuta]